MNNTYWAMAPTSEIAQEIKDKVAFHHQWLANTGYGDAMQKLYDAYYNFNNGGFGITLSADKSSASVKVNHFKSLIQRIQGMVTGAKLQYNPRARNSDSKSQIQADFAKGLLEFYQDEKNMDEYTSEMVERALIMLESYIHAPFDKSQGTLVTQDDLTGEKIMTGDQNFMCLSAFDVVRHHTLKVSPYYIVRVPINKYDLAAEYPHLAEQILMVSDTVNTKGATYRDRIQTPFDTSTHQYANQDDDIVYKYTLYHSKTSAIPKGRQTEIVGDVVLSDTILQYKTIPVVRLTCADMLETVGGDSPATSLLSLQEPMDKLWSAVTTNNLALAKINIYSTSAIEIEQLSEGMQNIIGAQEPKALALANSSAETYKLIESYQAQEEILSGVNKTARGNPDSSVDTAGGQALMLAQAVEFVSDLQRQYARAASELATIVIHNLQVFGDQKRTAYIGGISRASYVKEFTKADIDQVDRITADLGNSMSQTITGRWAILDRIMQSPAGATINPTKINEFLRTGQMDSLNEDEFKKGIKIREENEEIRKGEIPTVAMYDMHNDHFKEHAALAADPSFYNNPVLMDALHAHLQEHLDVWQSINPDIAFIMNLPPLPSHQMMPPTPPGPPQEPQNGPSGPPPPPDSPFPKLPKGTPPEAQQAYDSATANMTPA